MKSLLLENVPLTVGQITMKFGSDMHAFKSDIFSEMTHDTAFVSVIWSFQSTLS